MKVGVVFASTGGEKTVRALRSFKRMERWYPLHVCVDASSNSWNSSGKFAYSKMKELAEVRLVENHAHINGTLNRAMEWMEEKGCTHAALFHDDLVFSPFWRHKGSVSKWFTDELLSKSAITFCHLEAFGISSTEQWARKHPMEWDVLNLENRPLWKTLMSFKRENAYRIYHPGENWFCHYEGCDKVRKWNRLGPTGQVVPIGTWNEVGKFSETNMVHYDQDYTIKCFRKGLPPNYAVPNVPWLHLHNQSMNPWFDPAPGSWGTREAMIKEYGADWGGIWGNDWEDRWEG